MANFQFVHGKGEGRKVRLDRPAQIDSAAPSCHTEEARFDFIRQGGSRGWTRPYLSFGKRTVCDTVEDGLKRGLAVRKGEGGG